MRTPATIRLGWRSAPQVSATQWTGQIPPSLAKCGVDAGCQSCVYNTGAPAATARCTSSLTRATISSPPRTDRLPAGSAKSFCRSTTMSALVGPYFSTRTFSVEGDHGRRLGSVGSADTHGVRAVVLSERQLGQEEEGRNRCADGGQHADPQRAADRDAEGVVEAVHDVRDERLDLRPELLWHLGHDLGSQVADRAEIAAGRGRRESGDLLGYARGG